MICPGPDLDRVIEGVAIGAMEPNHMLERIGPRVAGHRARRPRGRDRDADGRAPDGSRARRRRSRRSSTRRRAPVDAGPEARRSGWSSPAATSRARRSSHAIREAGLFAAAVDEDTYTVASEVHDLLVKTHAADTEKIELIKALVWEFLKMDRFLEAASEARVPA